MLLHDRAALVAVPVAAAAALRRAVDIFAAAALRRAVDNFAAAACAGWISRCRRAKTKNTA